MVKQFFNILILLAVFSQVIAVSVEENEQSSNILLRKKRVIHSHPRAAVPRYVVSIVKDREHICGGAILATNIILTAAYCFDHTGNYSVVAGAKSRNEAIEYRITHKQIHPHYNPHDFANNLALLVVAPNIPLKVRFFNRETIIGSEPVRSGSLGVLSGWGSNTLNQRSGITYPLNVESTHLEVLTWQDCARLYGNHHTQITSLEICTYDSEALRRSGYGDVGSPLTVAGYLVGILSWSRILNVYTPDVYTNVTHLVYKEWIRRFMHIYGQ